MARLLALLLVLLALAAPASAQDKAQAFQDFVRHERDTYRLPALSVGVANAAGVITVARTGVRDLEKPRPVAPGDRYHLGSLAKPLTATLIARLVDQGRMRWDSTPAEVWPELAAGMDPAFRTITLEQILRHRAGLPALESPEALAAVPRFSGPARTQRAAFARWLTARPPAGKPGAFAYSNAGYGLAAAMAEQAAGESWDVLMRREVFAPLRMEGCGFGWPPSGQPRGHRWQGGRFAVHDLSDGYRVPAILAPAADIHCSVEDMLAFGRAHMVGDPLLKPATWAKLHDAPVDGYALGWFVTGFGYHHLGATQTYTASLVISPKRDLVVFMAANAAGFPGQGDLVSQVATRAFADFARPGLK